MTTPDDDATIEVPWAPPSQRLLGNEIVEPATGVPAYLIDRLDDWASLVFRYVDGAILELVALRLRVRWSAPDNTNAYRMSADDVARSFIQAVRATKNAGQYLDMIEAALRHASDVDDADTLRTYLEILLYNAGSAYTLDPTQEHLVFRVDVTAEAAARHATQVEDEASTRLAKAWNSAMGRDPDAQAAWGHAIGAVEAALIPIVWPDPATRGRQTLSSARRKIEEHIDLWVLGPDVEDPTMTAATLIAMIRAMTYEPRRHGADGREPATHAQAVAMVHLAVTLVSWLRAGLLQRRE